MNMHELGQPFGIRNISIIINPSTCEVLSILKSPETSSHFARRSQPLRPAFQRRPLPFSAFWRAFTRQDQSFGGFAYAKYGEPGNFGTGYWGRKIQER